MARDILPLEFGGGGGESGGGKCSREATNYDGVVGDIFFGKDDVKEFVWDGVFTEATVRLIERESAMKALRKRSKRKPQNFNCFEFLKHLCSFNF